MAEANDGDQPPSLPRRGKVQSVRQQWSVHEDGALAYRIQNEEIDHHYGLNRFNRRTVREDIPVAKIVQTEEELRQQEERMRELEVLKAQAEEDEAVARRVFEQQKQEIQSRETIQELDDEEIARQLQEKEKKKYERHLEKKREKRLKQERRRIEEELARDTEEAGLAIKSESGSDNVADSVESLNAQGTNATRVTPAGHIEDGGDFSDFYNLPQEMDEFTRLEIQASQDEELARLLQEQEHKRTKAEVDKGKLKRIEQQDEELARVMQEQEKIRLRKAKVKHQQKKEAQRQKAAESLPLGASANTMNLQQHHQQTSVSGSQQHSPHTTSQAIPISENTGGGGGGQHPRYRRNSYTQAFDSPPSPPRSQPPPRPSNNGNRGRSDQRRNNVNNPHSNSSHPPPHSSSPYDPPTPPSSLPPASSSHIPPHHSSSSNPHPHPSSSSVHKAPNPYSNRPPMPIPSSSSHHGNHASSPGMSTLESARRIAAGDHEGILAAQNSLVSSASSSSSPHVTTISTMRDGSNADVIRSSGHAKLSGSRSVGPGVPQGGGGGGGSSGPPPFRQMSAGESYHDARGRAPPQYHQRHNNQHPGQEVGGGGGGHRDLNSGGRGNGGNNNAHWLSGSMNYSDEEEEEYEEDLEDPRHHQGSPYLNGSSGFNIATAIDPTYQRRYPEASRFPSDETQVKSAVPFSRSLPQADGEVEWDPGLRGSLRKTKAPTYGYPDSTVSSTMSAGAGDPGWQPIQGQRRTDTRSKKVTKKQMSAVAADSKKDKNSNCKQQ